MEDSGLKINILTPSGQIYSEGIISCMIPGIEGQFQILEKHTSLLSIVEIGLIKIVDTNSKILYLATSGGMCEVVSNSVNLVVESAEFSSKIDVNRAEEAKQRAERRLAEDVDSINNERAKISLFRALNRLKIAQIN